MSETESEPDLVGYLKLSVLLSGFACLSLAFLRSKKNLPPGPWGVPILGYLPFLSPNEPHLQVEKLRQKYGDVFGMYLGSKYALFLCDLDISKAAFQMDVFNGRPEGAFPISKKSTHFAALNEEPWKMRRKLTSKALRQLGIGGKMIEDLTKVEMRSALLRVKDHMSPTGDVNLSSFMTMATLNVMMKFVCGRTFPAEHQNTQTVLNFMKFFGDSGLSVSISICMPWAKPLISYVTPYERKSEKMFQDMENFMRSEIQSHLQDLSEIPKDLIDFYLHHYGHERVDEISGDAQIMIFGGADTVRATLEWFLLCMAEHQDVQDKVSREIDGLLGPDGDVTYQDRDKLPYTEAAILESLRVKTPAPINPYHSSLHETTFHGYDIPRDSLIFSSLHSIHTSPKYWSHPDRFHPEHFLNPDERSVKVPEAFVAFVPGKRKCVGQKVGLIATFLLCVLFLQKFKVLPPDGGLKQEGCMRITMEPQLPAVKLVPRHEGNSGLI